MVHPLLEPSMGLSKETLDYQLSPSRTAKDAEGTLAELVRATEAALNSDGHRVSRKARYGERPRQVLDVFSPQSAEQAPCLVFVHGGFWQEGSKEVSGFAARSFTDYGWAYVSVGYTLTPDVTLTELTEEIHAAIQYLHANAARFGIDPRKIVVAGHSAGGHLVASLVTDLFHTGMADLIAGAVPISGVFELAPIAKSYVNDLAQITESEIEVLSPARATPKRDIPVHMVIGGDEPDAFQAQTDALITLWRAHLTDLSLARVPGRDHFDILHILDDPQSETFKTITAMIEGQ